MQSDQHIKITQGDAKQISAPLHHLPHRHPAYGPINRRCFLEFAITSTSAHVRNLTFTQVLKFMYFWQLFGYNLNPDAFVSLSAAIKKEIDAISNQSKVADSLVLRKMGVQGRDQARVTGRRAFQVLRALRGLHIVGRRECSHPRAAAHHSRKECASQDEMQRIAAAPTPSREPKLP